MDDIALIRSMYGEHANHEPALFLMHTGRTIASRPSLGSWVTYGLGTENQNLPAYVVLDDPKGSAHQRHRQLAIGLPSRRLSGHPLPLPKVRRSSTWTRAGNAHASARRPARPPRSVLTKRTANSARTNRELDARISSYELAARMQMSASDALDRRQGIGSTLAKLYGLNEPPPHPTARAA